MDERIIMHSDMNTFYASVEQAEHPELRGRPVVVAGKEELRCGIVLTKSQEAKAYGIKTAEALWEARAKCPGLIVLPPDYPLYKKYSAMARDIYYQYTDLVEPFGLDESWLDVTGSVQLHGGSPRVIAEEISERIHAELGVTVSIGVSWNKIFAKFGSDFKKPDAITEITRENYRDVVWGAPVGELLYVGHATERKLAAYDVRTIGDLAHATDAYLTRRFGKIGLMLRTFARGEDATQVKTYDPTRRDVERTVKSYGNGLTAPHDILDAGDAKALIYLLSESVAQRLREDGMRARTIAIGVRDGDDLTSYTRQTKLPFPTAATRDVARTAWTLVLANERFDGTRPIRGLHVRATDLVAMSEPEQLSLFESKREVVERLDFAIDELRRRFGNLCVQRGAELADETLAGVDIKGENTVHPVGYLHS
ncbi:DNA polymerase Y family protein [Raoultibacter phocaeensis]|uniref:DNA polymerase Y family protein n=1 Tax=Raoultibacter phocaeensis TaxID=2479841 RepID=UPI00111A5F3E|nr:DNA polymerase IV [Raoultibacter phocaeensis]